MITHSTNKGYWLNNLKKLGENWGQSKGGLKTSKRKDRSRVLRYVRSFKKIKKIRINPNSFFCEFYGILLGDGCISRFKDYQNNDRIYITFSMNKKLDLNYLRYLKEKIKTEFGLYSYYYEYKNKNVAVLVIKNKGFCLDLNKNFKVPIGEKYEKLKISKRVLNLPWHTKKLFLRGLFDTDVCILANKREDYKYPWVVITSKNLKFLNKIKMILKKRGYPAYITGTDICVRGINNVKRWFEDIGSSNDRNILKYKYFLNNRYLPARLLGQ